MSAHEYFRRSVFYGAGIVGVFFIRCSKFFGEAKICQLDIAFSADEDIIRFEILGYSTGTLWK